MITYPSRLAIALLGTAAAFSQSFDVASVKPAAEIAGGKMRMKAAGSPGTLIYGAASLKLLVARAYGVKEFQISGPEWINSARFDITAKYPPETPQSQVDKMLQTLLAERFHLVFHREEKTIPVYALTVGKSGPKLEGADPSLDSIRFSMNPKGRQVMGVTTISALTEALSSFLDRPVVDLTAITGFYRINLQWTPDESEGASLMAMKMKYAAEMQAAPKSGPGDGASDPTTFPSLVGALQQSLGLKLEPRKHAAEILVVDSADKMPTEN